MPRGTVKRDAEAWLKDTTWYQGYAAHKWQPPYGVYVSNWNALQARDEHGHYVDVCDLPARVKRVLSALGVECAWSDAVVSCDACDGLVETYGTYTTEYEGAAAYYLREELTEFSEYRIRDEVLCPKCARIEVPLAFARADLAREYDVDTRGMITTPGRFAGQPLWLAGLWREVQSGNAGYEEEFDGIAYFGTDVSDAIRRAWPEMPDDETVWLYESEDGGVCWKPQAKIEMMRNEGES